MTQYLPYGVKLSEFQLKKLSKAFASRSPITLRLEKSDLKGNDELMLTKTQIKRIKKAMGMNKGVDIKISKTQIRKVVKHGGSLWSSLAGLASKALPMVIPLAKKAAVPLATGALSGLASVGVNKLFDGKGLHVDPRYGGAFQIPNNMLQNLMNMADLLTKKQLSDVMNAINMGLDVIIKPTKAQTGRGIGTILASIGIPMLLDSILGKGLQVDSRSRGSLPIYVPKKYGGEFDLRPPPPFYGSWDQNNYPIGMGVKKKKRSRFDIGKKQSVQKHSINRRYFLDKPLNNFDLINWVKQLGIKHFRGVFSRDDLPSQNK